jgi:hypothetical protein
MNRELNSDYRIQELLSALNEGILKEEFVKARLQEFAGKDAELIQYSNGEYDIISAGL